MNYRHFVYFEYHRVVRFLFVTFLCNFALFLVATPPVEANVVGVGAQNFNPTPDGLDFVTVQSSKTLEPGIINFGLFFNEAWNTLPFIDSGDQSRVKLDDTLLGMDVNFAVGILQDWEVGLSLPAVLNQTVKDEGDIHGEFSRPGNTEVRVNTKYRLFGNETRGVALVGTINFDQVADDPYAGTGAGPVYNIEVAGDHALGKFVFGLNFGRRFRDPGTPIAGAPLQPLRDQWIASVAMSRLITDVSTKLIAEIFAAAPAVSAAPNETRNNTSAELLIGAKHDWSTQLALHAGFGTALITGVSSPDWRVYVGLNYAFGPLWGHSNDQVKQVPVKNAPVEGADEEPPSSSLATKAQENFRVGNILFEFNSAALVAGHEQMLQPLLDHLKATPFKHLTIEGYTDSVGRASYNLDLSRRRAESVRAYLIKAGPIAKSKVDAVGYGAEHPIESNSNYQGRQANRRVEFKIEH